MFIINEQPEMLNMLVVLGFIGWIADKVKGAFSGGDTKERAKTAVATATKPIEHARQYAASGRDQATKAAQKSADRPKNRRVRRTITRNQESPGAYRRRTSRS